MGRASLAVMGLLLVAMPAAAQDKGTVEIGVFGRAIKYPKSYGRTRAYDKTFDDLFGIGGRLGYFVGRNLALEVDGSYNTGDLLPNPPLILPTVDYQAVASVVGDWTGIPVGRMAANEIETVLKLPKLLGMNLPR